VSTLLARNARVVVTMDATRREIAGGGLFARDGIIETVGPDADLPDDADTIVDLTDQILLPGLVNAHHHLDQTLTRAIPAAQDAGLFDWLGAHYRIWARRTPEASRTATIVGLAELALSGCTTVFDHAYLFRNGCRVDDQIAAAAETGLRFMVSRGSMSRGQSLGGLPPDDCVETEDFILADTERVIARHHDPAHGAMRRIVVAPCSPFSVTETLMRQSAALARAHDVRLHTHLCETLDEERYTLAHHGMRPVDYLDSLDWLAPDIWFAHAIHVDQREIGLFARHRTGICHCPSSNMRLASGMAPIRRYRDAGVDVGLGVDGSASNDSNHMLAEARQAMLLARLRQTIEPAPWFSAREALELATIGGAAVLGRADIGALEAGRCADFFTLDLTDVAYAGAQADPVAATVFCAPRRARHTFVHGRPVVADGRFTSLDLEPVVAEHNRHAKKLLDG
jgi:cytosine/adenosine deaminase-related metal-dependent hydrolase